MSLRGGPSCIHFDVLVHNDCIDPIRDCCFVPSGNVVVWVCNVSVHLDALPRYVCPARVVVAEHFSPPEDVIESTMVLWDAKGVESLVHQFAKCANFLKRDSKAGRDLSKPIDWIAGAGFNFGSIVIHGSDAACAIRMQRGPVRVPPRIVVRQRSAIAGIAYLTGSSAVVAEETPVVRPRQRSVPFAAIPVIQSRIASQICRSVNPEKERPCLVAASRPNDFRHHERNAVFPALCRDCSQVAD
jgi:hypothetical protein